MAIRRRPAPTQIRWVALSLLFALAFPVVVSAPAQAKIRRSERTTLISILEGTFSGPVSTASYNCVANRLPAGSIEDLAIDAAFAFDVSELADSLAFRKVMRAVFLCKPNELVASMADSFVGLPMTGRQRSCAARSFVGRIGANDVVLTVVIRTGASNIKFGSFPPGYATEFALEFLAAIRGCVPRATYDEIASEV